MTPPSVSIPSESGVTSNNTKSLSSPLRTPPCIAAPIATASSGFTALLGAFPNTSCTVCWIHTLNIVSIEYMQYALNIVNDIIVSANSKQD